MLWWIVKLTESLYSCAVVKLTLKKIYTKVPKWSAAQGQSGRLSCASSTILSTFLLLDQLTLSIYSFSSASHIASLLANLKSRLCCCQTSNQCRVVATLVRPIHLQFIISSAPVQLTGVHLIKSRLPLLAPWPHLGGLLYYSRLHLPSWK